jgi:hypothetical protein
MKTVVYHKSNVLAQTKTNLTVVNLLACIGLFIAVQSTLAQQQVNINLPWRHWNRVHWCKCCSTTCRLQSLSTQAPNRQNSLKSNLRKWPRHAIALNFPGVCNWSSCPNLAQEGVFVASIWVWSPHENFKPQSSRKEEVDLILPFPAKWNKT